MSSRSLTAAELGLARTMFADAIDYSRVKIIARKWWPFQPRQVAMAPDGNLWLSPKGDLFCEDFCERPLERQGLFIHEMTHVWQHQQGINLIVRRHPFCRYGYTLQPHRAFGSYGIEQQAEIVRHAFLLRHGAHVQGAPPLAIYKDTLPFPMA